MDTFSKAKRSDIMRSVKSQNTIPEKIVKKTLARIGVRYQAGRKENIGHPDILVHEAKTAIYVHGCFWHRHSCDQATLPATNRAYWQKKFRANVIRDKKNAYQIRKQGWKVLIIWECKTKNTDNLAVQLKRQLDKAKQRNS